MLSFVEKTYFMHLCIDQVLASISQLWCACNNCLVKLNIWWIGPEDEKSSNFVGFPKVEGFNGEDLIFGTVHWSHDIHFSTYILGACVIETCMDIYSLFLKFVAFDFTLCCHTLLSHIMQQYATYAWFSRHGCEINFILGVFLLYFQVNAIFLLLFLEKGPYLHV